VIKVKVNPHQVIERALEFAINRGMNRCDKYSEVALTDGQRELLAREIQDSFWLMLEEDEVTLG